MTTNEPKIKQINLREKRCYCAYDSDGKALGFCYRCFKMGLAEYEKGMVKGRKELLAEIAKDSVIVERGLYEKMKEFWDAEKVNKD